MISRVHGEFMGDASTTDVITFPYGEILICPAVAQERVHPHRLGLEDEVLLYALHGLLHLAGYDDRKLVDARKMSRAQMHLLRQVKEVEP